MTDIKAYRGIAESTTISNDERLVYTRQGGITRPGKIKDFFTKSVTLQEQNRSTMRDFTNALYRGFGEETQKKVKELHLTNANGPLTAGRVRTVLRTADNFKALADFKKVLIQQSGHIIADRIINEMSDGIRNGEERISPMQRVQAYRRSFQLLDGAETTARKAFRRIAGRRDQEIVLLDTTQKSAISNAVNSLQGLCPHRLQIYRPCLEKALAQVAPRVLQAAAQGEGQNLLNSVARQIAERMDEFVLEGVYQHAVDSGQIGIFKGDTQDRDYSPFISSFGRNGEEKFTYLAGIYPSLIRNLELQARQLAEGIKETATRIHRDRTAIRDTFFSNANPAPTGIKDITITSSDPHHDGRRVMVLSFDGQGNNKVVYKPRDVRIDAKLVGKGNQQDIGQSIGAYIDNLLKSREMKQQPQPQHLDMPTYKFLAKDERDGNGTVTGRYGYVEHLSHGTDGDNRLNRAEAKKFYRNFGRQIAMFLLLGIRDLHHTNIFVSGKQPVFTDLEIGFHEGILKNLQKPEDGDTPKDVGSGLSTTLVHMALTSSGEHVRRPRVKVQNDRLVVQNRYPSKDVIENLVKIGNSDNRSKETRRQYSGDIKQGFREVMEVLGARVNSNLGEVNTLINGFRGLHVRYHPIDTGTQLSSIDIMKKNGLIRSTEQERQVLTDKAKKVSKERKNSTEPLVSLREKLANAWGNHDVAYFTRSLGSKQVLFNGKEPVQTGRGDNGSDYFSLDTLATVRQIMGNLKEQSYLDDLIQKGEKWLEETMG